MARFWAIWVIWLAWSGGVFALSPAEPPPEGFKAQQYIDSKGCVFIRDQRGWQARLDRDGTPVCGYPPTLSLRELAPTPPRLDMAAQDGIEAELATQVAIAFGPQPPVPDHAPPASHAPAGDPVAELNAELTKGPVVRSAMTGPLSRDSRLCELLGTDPDALPGLGNDPALGYCGALKPLDLPVGANDPAVKMPSLPAERHRAATATPNPVDAKSGLPKRKAAQSPPAPKALPNKHEMIPPGARFVQVGTYTKPDEAKDAASKIARLGLPAARSSGGVNGQSIQIILAGPFDGREAVVVALNQLRRAGFTGAFARR